MDEGRVSGAFPPMSSPNEVFFECNCAPPPLSVRPLYRDVPSSTTLHPPFPKAPNRLQRAPEVLTVPIDEHHIACLSPHLSQTRVAVLHHRAFAFWNALPETPIDLQTRPPVQRALLLRFYEQGLMLDPDAATARPSPRASRFRVSYWIEVTPRCNLDCPYCYVPKQGRAMDMATAHRLLPELLRHAAEQGATTVQLTYAGGEPTLAWGRLWDIHRLAESLAQRYALRLEPVLVTNGTLLNAKRLEQLARAGFRIGFSMDGVDAHHDAHRATRNGLPTLHRVREAVLQARALGIPLRLINTITRLNLKGVPAFVAFAITHRLAFNLNFFRPTRWPHPLVPAAEALIATLRRAFRWIEAHLPPYRIIDGLLDRAFFGYPHLQACSAGGAYRAVNATGSQAPCPLLLGQGSPVPAFHVPVVTQREPCASCGWKYWCGGGCPVVAHRAHGTPHAASPYCQVYQALYPDLIRLEGLRVLRYTDDVLHAPDNLPLAA